MVTYSILDIIVMQHYIYIAFIALVIIGASMVLFSRNILYAALSLFFAFLGISGIYVFASVDFLAITQLVIYIGGVLVLVLFGIMLSNRVSSVKDLISPSANHFLAYPIGAGLLAILIYGIQQLNLEATVFQQIQQGKSVIKPIGISLMTDNLLLFELAAILLLVVLVGTAYLISNQNSNKEIEK